MSHLINLAEHNVVLKPSWGLACICSVYDHVLFGTDTMLTRSASLTTLRDCRFRILATMPKSVRDEYKGA